MAECWLYEARGYIHAWIWRLAEGSRRQVKAKKNTEYQL